MDCNKIKKIAKLGRDGYFADTNAKLKEAQQKEIDQANQINEFWATNPQKAIEGALKSAVERCFSTGEKPATDKQVWFLAKLINENETNPREVAEKMGYSVHFALSSSTASFSISNYTGKQRTGNHDSINKRVNEMINNSTDGGIGFLGVLMIVFIVLKITGYIAWSWWWVLAPFWIPVLFSVIFLGLYLLVKA